jgi:hypothetical protein
MSERYAFLDVSTCVPDTVPHNKLLNKLEEYDVRGSVNNWLANFLTKRSLLLMKKNPKKLQSTGM